MTLIVGAELRDPDDLAALNPGMDARGLHRLQLWAQLLDEDDAEHGYLEPGEDEEAHR
jgi:hypothetical protein